MVKDQWDCVLNDLEELGDKECLVLTGRSSIEIFSCCLRLLPSCSSTYRQTNVESAQICSEDHLSVSRIRPPDLLLEVIVHAEEECLVFLPLGMLALVIFGLLTGSPVRLSRRTPGRSPFHPRAVLPRPAPRTHPLPASPFQ